MGFLMTGTVVVTALLVVSMPTDLGFCSVFAVAGGFVVVEVVVLGLVEGIVVEEDFVVVLLCVFGLVLLTTGGAVAVFGAAFGVVLGFALGEVVVLGVVFIASVVLGGAAFTTSFCF